MGRKRLSYDIREKIIELFETNKKIAEIARKIGVSNSSVRRTIKSYKAELL